ncbi:VWA domain-containing protein [Methanolobus sp.]|uniref:VWA domain-containing protein n=1 Tax=Methanolobus sp. TaxID=1874737 RepID=UPI0025DF4F6E|nr:VWA domain-containing protein [Methanolobus sp.]
MKCPNKFIYASIIFLAISLSALALDVEMLTTDMQSNSGEPVDVIVRVTNNSTPMNNTLVNFTTTFGILNSSSAYTDVYGIAAIQLNSSVSGAAQVNASAGTSYNLTNITFLPLAASSILVDVDYPVNVAGNITNITFTPVDIFGNTNSSELIYLEINISDYSEIVTLSISPGNITHLEIIPEGSAGVNWTALEILANPVTGNAVLSLNSTIAGNINITSTTGSASNFTELVFIPGEPSRIGAVYNDEYTVNTTSSMYVRLYDIYDNPTPNINLNFSLTSPENTAYNSPVEYNSAGLAYYNGTTDPSGQFANIFRTDKRAGANIINIVVANTSLQGNITITGIADEIDNLYLSHNPGLALSNNKDSYVLSARPIDQFLNPILPRTTPIKELVRFTTASGYLVLIPLNNQGQANTIVGPTPYVESLTITATYRDASGYTNFTNSTTLYFVAGSLYLLDLYSVPNAILAQGLNGNHEATVSLVALDEWGHALPGISVALNNTNTTVGTLAVSGVNATNIINVTTDANGKVKASFLGNVSGNATILATSGSINTSINISVKSEPFMSVTLDVKPSNVTSGGTVNVTTIISIEGELPIIRPAASAMLVLDRSGSMDPDYYAGTPLDVVLVIDRSGSMKFLGTSPEQPMTDAKIAAGEFVDNLASNAQAGVVSFSTSSRMDIGMTLLHSYNNKTSVKGVIDVLVADGSTAMGDAMADANNMLINGRPESKKVMIVLTDGVSNAGSDREGQAAVTTAKANGITIYTIGLGETSYIDEPVLQRIAFETEGIYYNAPTSAELREVYNSIAQEISDYDVRFVEYGTEGFTPYDYTFQGSIDPQESVGIQEYVLKFQGYDLDTVFNAGSQYGGSSAGECLIQINGANFTLIPSSNTPSANNVWVNYEYNITAHLASGSNTVTFYDYYAYLGNGDWTSRIRNVELFRNGTRIAYHPTDTDLSRFGYECSLNLVKPFEETLLINETINDLKVQLDWEDSVNDLSLQLTSPSGIVYGLSNDTTGYYSNGDTSIYIWIQPLSYIYPDDDADTVEKGNWTVTVEGTDLGDFTISTYIDKMSAAKLSSHAFISSFDESRGDKAGLALYSIGNVSLTDSQASYLLDNGSWAGYFTVQTNGIYSFDISWDDTSEMNVSLYEGIDLLNSSTINTGVCQISSPLYVGKTYLLEIAKGPYSGTDTHFTVDVSSSPLDTIMTTYYDGSDESGKGTPRFRTWEGSQWSMESYSNFIDGVPYFVLLEPSPVRDEIIMVTGDDQNDVNAQIWDGNSWSSVQELSTKLSSSVRRGFDVKYEQESGDAVVVYMNVNKYSNVPLYRVWNSSSWGSEAAVDSSNTGAGTIQWMRLEAKPNSDEMVLVTLDSSRDIRAQVWDGDSWGNVTQITNNARTANYQCFDVIYEQGTGRAMVVWADSNKVRYRIWNGISWESGQDLYSFSNDVYWIKLAADPNSERVILGSQDEAYDVYVGVWDGSSWPSSQLGRIEDNTYRTDVRSFDVAFEQQTGKGIVVWGDRSTVPKYRTWSGSWSSESSALDLGSSGYTRWVQLTPDPISNEVFLMTSDGNTDLNIQKWSGSSFISTAQVEPSSTWNYECFDIVFSTQEASVESTPVSWSGWTAGVTSTLENDSISHLSNAIDTITADGLTAIDEGLYVANNELSSVDGNSTIVIMTDGIDNAGYHSLLEEAYRAKANNTTIYTVGFGNTESEVDSILAEIASITGGEYYFAPNSSVLKEIFTGIAMQITNFSAGGPELNLHVPYNYVSPMAVAKVTYVTGSSNATTGNLTQFDIPIPPGRNNAEPAITTSGTMSIFEWKLPTLGPGDKWGIWYQMKVEGAGYVPLILPSSTITYTDLSGENITIYIPSAGGMPVGGGGGLSPLSYSLGELLVVPDHSVLQIGESTNITLTVNDITGNASFAYVVLHTSLGSFTNYNTSYGMTPINATVIGSDHVNFTSQIAGKAYITAYAYNTNNVSDMLNESELILVRPKGMITIS